MHLLKNMKNFCLCVLLTAAVGVSTRPADLSEYEYLDSDTGSSTSPSTVEGSTATTVDNIGFDDSILNGLEDEYSDRPSAPSIEFPTNSSTTQIPEVSSSFGDITPTADQEDEVPFQNGGFVPLHSGEKPTTAGQISVQNVLHIPDTIGRRPAYHEDSPTRLVVHLSRLERNIARRFKEASDKSDKIDQRVTSLLNEWIHSLRREDLANKEATKAEKAERLAQIGKLVKDNTDKFTAARRERVTLYKNADSLRRTLNSQKAKHDEDLKRLAIGTGQNFAIVQKEITRLFNMVNRLSQIQNGELYTSTSLE